MTFKTNQLFKYVTYNKDADSWYFVFEGKTSFNLYSFWRLLVNKEICEVSFDNGHKFGLPEPVELVERITRELTGGSLLEIKVKQNTGDLLLTLTDNIQIEVFISSMGYETYNFTFADKNYIGLGAGEITIMSAK